MKILLLGATGRVGSEIAAHARSEGHSLTVLVRHPEKIENRDESITIVQGNVLNQLDISQVMLGNEVVICALGTDGDTTLSDCMPLIVEAMNNHGIKRIITIGTAGILNSKTNQGLLRYQSSESKRRTTRAAEEHHKAYLILKQSDLEWTIVCPTYLPLGEAVGTYRVERDYLPDGGTEISVYDTAAFAYHQLKSREYMRSRVGIAY
ncbi:oxidoreductase [Paenibacillus baekrokdamisoli]|uniref:Oxidoreductase n=1 Tax=Paenibacillus baekrokdamisoli TaxID=1712516 RepID=A0A3G9IV79_9BACL|nr:SDR family oxidoreductase [Paenibacillus baekrokdamisoli]MBB3070644.1 putative NADH-flavin reductase [Paenibacillus baekrokdamisoli]BBH19995.1 oxidoreductase [Paenibacillus baekrokdamisoli]